MEVKQIKVSKQTIDFLKSIEKNKKESFRSWFKEKMIKSNK